MRLKKPDWYARRASGEIKDNEVVRLRVLPHGCWCQIEEWEGSIILRNGETAAVNSNLGTLLWDAGIKGDVLINSTNSLPQTVSRWLTWWLSAHGDNEKTNFNSIRVAVADTLPEKELPFEVEVLRTFTAPASEVINMLMSKSHDHAMSMLAVERENGEYFELEPMRYVDGEVLAFTDHGYIVKTGGNSQTLPIIISRVARSARAVMELVGAEPQDIVGHKVRIQYTMNTPGHRLQAYKNAVIHSIDGIYHDNTDEVHERMDQNGEGTRYPLPVAGTRSTLLTPSRCERSRITFNGTMFTATSLDSDDLLFEIVPDVKEGQYGIILNRYGVQTLWRIDTPYHMDVISPAAFMKHVDDNLYHATGFSIDGLGLYYTDTDGVSWVGDKPLSIETIVNESVASTENVNISVA
tara:strand:+ start:3345 stop:4571 length:1227 start_codon:yes stop_codon:yes gene_type:complete